MNKQQIRELYYGKGLSTGEVLRRVIDSGMEYPDATFRVRDALRMNDVAVEEMEAEYDGSAGSQDSSIDVPQDY